MTNQRNKDVNESRKKLKEGEPKKRNIPTKNQNNDSAKGPAGEKVKSAPAKQAAKPSQKAPQKSSQRRSQRKPAESAAEMKNTAGDSVLKIIPLGGLNEIGKNMTVYQYEDDIIVVDSGLAFPEDELLGIDVVIPDITYLKKNASKVKGIVLTHGHEDHIGGLPYVLKDLNVPVYGTNLTLGLVENKLKEHRLPKTKLIRIVPGQIIKLGVFEIEPIRVCHSIADSVAFAIKTPLGVIVQTGDFKIDYTPIDGQKMDLHRFAQLGSEGVLALLADSTNVVREGYTMSERTVGETFEQIFRQATSSRIIVASFASNVHRIQQIINAADMNDRKVAFSGRSMVNVSNVALELGYLKCSPDIIIDIKDIDRYPENEIVVITTGSQGETMSALARMANSEHRNMDIVPGDTVILSSSPIPGNEKSVYQIINKLTQKGAHVIYESLADVHVSGHAKQEELKLIHTLVKPKYFLPVHGEYVHLNRHKELAEELGMNNSNIFILSNGGVLEFSAKGAKIGKSVQAGRVFIDGLGVGDVGNIVLRDRKHLSEDGLIIIAVALSEETGEVVNGPDLISRGFVYVRESEALMDGARSVIDEELKRCFSKNIKDWATLKSSVKDALSQYIYQSTKRSPMILPIFMEVK
ncbi:MAG: ribonuclease [Clostridiales bacterium]|nr:ribonuclease [Clostridiales bacterium]MDN5299672.1 ribonuclease [Clostridiales bacterium]